MYKAPKYPSHECRLFLFFVDGSFNYVVLVTLLLLHCLQDEAQKSFHGIWLGLKITF